MSGLARKLMAAASGVEKLYVDDVFSTQIYTGNGSTQTVSSGIDLAGKGGLVWCKSRDNAGGGWPHALVDTVRGKNDFLSSNLIDGNKSCAGDISAFHGNGITYNGPTATSNFNRNGTTYVNWFFRKAPQFFDIVTYTGDGVAARKIPHSLGAEPRMVIVKCTSTTGNWFVYHRNYNDRLILDSSTGGFQVGYRADITAASTTDFTLAYSPYISGVNASGATYVAYLFASLPGVIEVGRYSGNGGTQTISCGFATGARFVLIKRADAAGDWYVWDTARGIVAANDPHLSPNTTAAEVTTDDSIDPAAAGFVVNQNAATNINVNAGNYIFLAVA